MIRANELRLGNYVNVPSKEQCPFRIDGFEFLTKENGKIEQNNIIQGFYMHPLTWYIDDISPIELTEEWLIKLGFKDNSYANFFLFIDKETELWIMASFKDYACKEFVGISVSDIDLDHIKYVHQLQNLYFALTGEELTINT